MRAPTGWLAGLFLTVLVCFQFSIMAFADNPVPQLIDAVGLMALVASPFVYFFSRSNRSSRRFFGLLLIFLGCLAIATVLRGNPGASKWEAFGLDLLVDGKLYAVAFLLFALLPPAALARCLRQTLWILLIVGLINLPFVLRDLVSSTSIHGHPLQVVSGIHTPAGLFTDKVMSAEIQILATIAAMAFSLDSYWRRYPVWKPLIAILAVSVIVHLSVKELVALGTVLILFMSLRRGQHLGVRGIMICLFLFIILFFSTVDTPVKAAFLNKFDVFVWGSRGQTVRTAAYIGSFQLSWDYFPFGTGASTFMSKGARDLAYSPYYFKTGIAYLWGGTPNNPIFIMDTFWPKILAQSGWMGLLAYGGATLLMLRLSLRLYRRDGTGTAFAATAILFSMLIFSFAAPAYTFDHLILPTAIAFAFVLAAWHRRPARRPIRAREDPVGFQAGAPRKQLSAAARV